MLPGELGADVSGLHDGIGSHVRREVERVCSLHGDQSDESVLARLNLDLAATLSLVTLVTIPENRLRADCVPGRDRTGSPAASTAKRAGSCPLTDRDLLLQRSS